MALLAIVLVATGSTASLADDTSFMDRIRGLFGQEKSESVIDAVPYKVTINVVDADRSLRRAITAASGLQSMRRSPPSGAAGLLRRASADTDLITAALYGQGYYAGTIAITVAGRRVDSPDALTAIEMARKAGPVLIQVEVIPGPLFHFDQIELLDANNHRPIADVPTLKSLSLQAGDVARSTRIVAAESIITRFYRDRGYAFAKIVDKEVTADHATKTVDVAFYIETGRPVDFGAVTVSGTERLRKSFVEERVRILPGEMFSPQRIADTRKSLLKYEAISGVRIVEGEKLDRDGRLPMAIEVTERKPRYFGFGAKYGTTDGATLNSFWGHRNLFGGAETLRLDAQVSWYGTTPSAVPDADPFGYRFTASFAKPGIITPIDDLVAQAAVLREVTDAYVREAVTFNAGIRRNFTDQFSAQVGVDLEQSKVWDSTGEHNYPIAGLPIDVAYDTTDNVLDPSKGIRAAGTFEPFAYLGQAGGGPMMFKGTLSGYRAFDEDKRYIFAARVSAGTIFGADLLDVPPQRRFYVGGGGTLRGFDYQSQGPHNLEGDPIGGLSYVTASIEARVKITETIGIVPFLDIGTASAGTVPKASELGYGAGVGLRYYTAVGPVRFDVAVPLNPGPGQKGYGLYLSLGQSF